MLIRITATEQQLRGSGIQLDEAIGQILDNPIFEADLMEDAYRIRAADCSWIIRPDQCEVLHDSEIAVLKARVATLEAEKAQLIERIGRIDT